MKNIQIIRCKVLFLPLLLLLSTALFQSPAFAQAPCPDCECPPVPIDDAQHNPTPIPWNAGDTCVDLYGDGCMYKICYAFRQTSANNFDYMVTQVCFSEGCEPADSSDILQIIHDASWFIMQSNPSNFPCPPCPGGNIEWIENQVSCWKYVILPTGGKKISMCSNHGWCLHAYKVCCNPTTGQKTFTYLRSVTTTWQCASELPGPGEQFIINCNPYGCPPIH